MRKLILLILVLVTLELNAQDYNNLKREFTIVNISTNGLIGGLGALVNKKKDEKGFKVFLKGFGQGCLGGTFQILGKELTYQITKKENLLYAWPARITNAVGNSITQNAASNINFWERWHFNLGFMRFDYRVKEKKFQARLFASSIYSMIWAGSQAKFDLKKSLQTGVMVYKRDGLINVLGGKSSGGGGINTIAYDTNISFDEYYGLMAHEVMHVIQYENMVWINPFFDKIDQQLKSKSKFYNRASDFIYLDFNGVTFWVIYMTQVNQPWKCRLLEREADFYPRRRFWPKCN